MVETHKDAGSRVICQPVGSLDWIGAVALRHAIHDQLGQGVEVIIDLSRVSDIDAVGISAIVGSVRRAWSVGGGVRVRNPSLQVRRQMDLAGVYRLLFRDSDTNGDDAA